MTTIKTLIWKLRYAREIRRLLRLPLVVCWDYAGSALEGVDGDTTECPLEWAEYEYSVWVDSCDGEEPE